MRKKRTTTANGDAWLQQTLSQMTPGIEAGKTRRRKVETISKMKLTENDLKEAATERGWSLAQVGDDYVFAPRNYSIRPIA